MSSITILIDMRICIHKERIDSVPLSIKKKKRIDSVYMEYFVIAQSHDIMEDCSIVYLLSIIVFFFFFFFDMSTQRNRDEVFELVTSAS
jgi:hypothetical protein